MWCPGRKCGYHQIEYFNLDDCMKGVSCYRGEERRGEEGRGGERN
jgi:hypothetical protein